MGYLDSEGLAYFWNTIKDRLPGPRGPVGPRGPAGPDGNPIGTVISFMGTNAPKDYLVCDGASYNVADYPNLAAFFAEQFGEANHFGGDGTTTFAVPDMRNLFLRGYHGGAEEQLSGEIGERQEATQIPYTLGQVSSGTIYKVITNFSGHTQNNFVRAEAENPDKLIYPKTSFYQGVSVESKNITNFNDTNSVIYYLSRPVNMAVLYCIKAVESVPAESVYSAEETRIGTWIDGK